MTTKTTFIQLATSASLLAGLTLSNAAIAADETLPTPEAMWELIQSQQAELDALNTRVGETDDKVEATSAFVEDIAQNSDSSFNGTQIGGYGELHLTQGDKEVIDFHRWVLFFSHDFSDSIRMFSEFELEHSLAGDGKPGEVELEQAYIEMDLNETSKIKAGLFLVPVGLLNETHEPNTFYGVERNNIEKEIIPSTWWEAGFAYTKQFESGFSTDIALHSGLNTPTAGSNAFRIRSGRGKVAEAAADSFATTARINWSAIPGVKLSASLQYQQDVAQGTLTEDADAMLYTLHADIQQGGFGLRALYAAWDISGATAKSFGRDQQEGVYIEPSYKFPVGDNDMGVFIRYGMYDTNAGNAADTEIDSVSIGANYWPHPNVVFKVDYTKEEQANSDTHTYNFGIGYQF